MWSSGDYTPSMQENRHEDVVSIEDSELIRRLVEARADSQDSASAIRTTVQIADPPRVSRRVFLNLAFATVAAYAVGIEPGQLVVRRADVRIPGLPQALNGLRIGQLSDLHRCSVMPRSRVERAVALIAAERPDLVVLTGDFVSYWPDYAAEYPQLLTPLRPPLGSFACTGNHDHWTDPEAVTTALRAAGVTVLRNQHAVIRIDDAQLCIIGIDDIGLSGISFHHADPADDLPAALADSPDSGVVRLLLAHNPDSVMKPVFAEQAARRPIALVLSGHTHGGQVRLPLEGGFRRLAAHGVGARGDGRRG